ncbi:MAG: immunity 26/phosphotriesterase HocA family protein, partial [Mucilaginibacter sp.]
MKQKEIAGAFVQIPIDEIFHTYGRILNNHVYAIYDCKTDAKSITLESIENSNILFKLIVHTSAVKNSYWKIIGKKDLPEDLKVPVPFFKQEIGDQNDCSIVADENIKKVRPEDCIGLERLAIWEHDHVE